MFNIYNWDMGGTYLVPMRNYCMDLKTLPGRGSPALVSLEEGYKDSEIQITFLRYSVSASLGLLHNL